MYVYIYINICICIISIPLHGQTKDLPDSYEQTLNKVVQYNNSDANRCSNVRVS